MAVALQIHDKNVAEAAKIASENEQNKKLILSYAFALDNKNKELGEYAKKLEEINSSANSNTAKYANLYSRYIKLQDDIKKKRITCTDESGNTSSVSSITSNITLIPGGMLSYANMSGNYSKYTNK